MTYKGIVRGTIIELEEKAALPEGTPVEVIVPETEPGARRGDPQVLAAALAAPPHCTTDDVAAFHQAIAEGKKRVRYSGPFDREDRRP